ncbi:AMP-binding protein [Eubacterium ventriosum]|uniref:AMP-binding protein n=1 Tax=Eubacterium ventriosum TaxID=39496 RepID=UPI00399A5305
MYYKDLRSAIEQTCRNFKNNKFITYYKEDDSEKGWTYKKAYEDILEIESLYQKLSCKEHDRVAIIMQHSPFAILAGMGLAYAGATLVLIDATLPIKEIEKLLKNSDVEAVFSVSDILENINKKIISQYPCYCLNAEGKFIHICDSKMTARECDIYDVEDDVMAILYSSGTTANMKGICITYQSIFDSISIYQKVSGVKEGTKYLFILPFNHIAGFTVAIQYFFFGCELGMLENASSSKLTEGFQKFQPEFFALVPKVYEVIQEKIEASIKEKGVVVDKIIRGLMSFSGFVRKNFGINIGKILFKSINKQVFGGKMTGLGTGASPCKKETASFFLNLGYNWADFYSSTETGVPAIATGINDRYPAGSVGNIHQFKEIEVKIVEADKDGIGEICVKTPLRMKGYFRDAELTRKAFDKEGYLKTGDLGYVNKKGYLYITGRKKEAILLHNGKKVSPIDVEEVYKEKLHGLTFACCGIRADDGFDEIHMFVEKKTGIQDDELIERVEKATGGSGLYRIARIHLIESIPMTTVGKIKRGALKEYIHAKSSKNSKIVQTKEKDRTIREVALATIAKLSGKAVTQISEDDCILEDIGLDSLSIFELVSTIEGKFGINIASAMGDVKTVDDFIRLSENPSTTNKKLQKYDIDDFPMIRTARDIRRLKRYMWLCSHLWKIEVNGIGNLPKQGNYILAPNHESHLDGLWIWTSICKQQKIDLSKICCMAKEEHLDSNFSSKFMNLLGGIPVERAGNTTQAMKKSIECLNNGYNMLIHPEGTRTRDGNIGVLKDGVASLSKNTQVPIIPVFIEGAREIYPPYRKYPKIFDFKHFRRRKIAIKIGKRIDTKLLEDTQVMNEIETFFGG